MDSKKLYLIIAVVVVLVIAYAWYYHSHHKKKAADTYSTHKALHKEHFVVSPDGTLAL